MTEMVKCKKCGAPGKITMISGSPYAQCSKCTKWDPYQFLGFSREGAIKVWNMYNSSGKIIEEEI